MPTLFDTSAHLATHAPSQRLPILEGFRQQILPTLIALWALVLVASAVWRQDFWLPLGLWASVTLLMLWPVGRRLGRPYSSYRRPLFILGVLSMAALPALGFFLEFLPPSSPGAPYLPRTWALLGVVAVLTSFSVIAASWPAIGKPTGMLFRPDILFGDGRVLGTGMIALGLSMGFLFAGVPEAPPHIPAPRGNWWGIAFAMAFGLIQIIPLRGIFKLRGRLARLVENRWTGWGAIVLREAWLVLAGLGLLFGFHNVFMGTTPILQPSLMGLEPMHFREAGLPGLVSTGLAALFLIFVRGGYKKAIGDPFVRETRAQSTVKAALLLLGLIWLFYSFAHVMGAQPFGNGPTTEFYPAIIGWSLFLWGVLMLGPIRIWAQHNQRLAIVQQMAAVFLPAVAPARRKEALLKVLHAVAQCPADQRRDYMWAMQGALNAAPAEVRQLMTEVRMECMVELPAAERRTLMASMDQLMTSA